MSKSEPELRKLQSASVSTPTSPITPPIPKKHTSTLSVRLNTYRGVNAFVRRPFSWYEKIKVFLMAITGIILARAILFIIVLLLMYLFSIPVTCCNKDLRKPLSCWRKPFQWIMYVLVRVALFFLGFVWISTTDKRKFTQNKPRIIVANHHTLYDGFILWWLCKGTAASRIENKIPIVGSVGDGFQTIWIDRIAKSGRKQAVKQILNHVSDAALPPLVIFPQGVCSEIGCITTFKKGAFISGLPVQPVAIDWYWNAHTDLSFLSENFVLEILYGMSQIMNFVTVEFLDVHEPTEKEKHDPMLYANDVRLEICNKLGVVSTAHTLSDYILLQHAKEKDAKFDTSRFVMEDVTERLLFRTRTVTRLCDVYCSLDADDDGFIDYPEFCAAFKRDPHSYQMIHLFRLFNTKSIGCEEDLTEYLDYEQIKDKRIGFEDFLVGVSVCYVDSMIEDAVRIMFDAVRESPHEVVMKQYVVESYKESKNLNLHWNSQPDIREEEEEEQMEEAIQSYAVYHEEMATFCQVMFVNEEEKVNFVTFYERVLVKKQQHTVHHFLQMLITFRLGIQLTESDFIDEDRIVVKVGDREDNEKYKE